PQLGSAAETKIFLAMANPLLGKAKLPRARSVGDNCVVGEPAVVHVPVQERRFSKAFPTRPVGPAPRIPSARRLEDSLGLLYRSPQTPFLIGSEILGRASITDTCASAHVRRSQVLLERRIVASRQCHDRYAFA